MAIVGYARVSTTDQSLEVQREQLLAAGAEKLFEEKRSGTSRDGRQALTEALEWVREGDVLLVTKLDRMARSLWDLGDILRKLEAKGVGFRVLSQSGIDTTTRDGKLLLGVLGALAEWENDMRRERQAEGIARAKAEGRRAGPPETIDRAELRRLRRAGVRPTHIARQLGIAKSSVYRLLAEDVKDSGDG